MEPLAYCVCAVKQARSIKKKEVVHLGKYYRMYYYYAQRLSKLSLTIQSTFNADEFHQIFPFPFLSFFFKLYF